MSYEILRAQAFEIAQPKVRLGDISQARANRRMAVSLRASVDIEGNEIMHTALKIVFPDKTEQTLLLDPFATQVLSEQLSQILALGWRTDALRPKGMQQQTVPARTCSAHS